MIKKILFADSGTGRSEELLQYLLELPALKDASVNILHVVPSQVTTEAMSEKWEEGGKILAQTIQNLQLDPSHVSTLLRQGDPKSTVCEVADEIDADLIIMGSRGLKRLESILENSVSQYVFQLTDRPMLLVKDDIYVKKINRIMVAMNRSAAAHQSLELALFLLKDLKGAELILARVNPDLSPDLLPVSPAEAAQNPVLAPAVKLANQRGVKTRCIVTGGRPGEKICKIAEDNNIDLLMMGSPERRPSIAKGLPDLDRLLGTSLSDYVRVYANCPVLLTRTSE
jgi:nucleotide-binding universal stress UspA family protein